MAQTMQQIMDAACITLNDDAKVRWPDSERLQYANDALDVIALARPDLFSVIGDITAAANTAVQSAPADSLRLMEIFRVKDGRVVREADRISMDQLDPNWMGATSSAATKNWMRHQRDPNRFFVYPPPTSGVIYIGQYAQTPPEYQAVDDFPLPDAYANLVQAYIIFRAESKDSEYATPQRSAAFGALFQQVLGVSVQSKAVADGE